MRGAAFNGVNGHRAGPAASQRLRGEGFDGERRVLRDVLVEAVARFHRLTTS
jgi:hypothetical protein